MTSLEKLEKIIRWYSENSGIPTNTLAKQEDFQRLQTVEKLIGKSIPAEIVELYRFYDGEKGQGYGAFFGHSLVNLAGIIRSLEFSKTLIKPDFPKLSNPKESEKLVDKIIDVVVEDSLIETEFRNADPEWHRLEFKCSPHSIEGPYLFKSSETTEGQRKVVELLEKTQEKVLALAKTLHEFESKDYNWDELEVVVYADGRKDVRRKYFNFDEELSLTSFPENAIKKKYFHIKWLPVLSDGGGNYIGIDLDPDEKGKKGQVIIFGRDEEHMFVVADSWVEFLDYNLELIRQGGDLLKDGYDIHRTYRKLIG